MADFAEIQPRQIHVRRNSLLSQILTDFNVTFSITPMPAIERIIFCNFCLLNRFDTHIFCAIRKIFLRIEIMPRLKQLLNGIRAT